MRPICSERVPVAEAAVLFAKMENIIRQKQDEGWIFLNRIMSGNSEKREVVLFFVAKHTIVHTPSRVDPREAELC